MAANADGLNILRRANVGKEKQSAVGCRTAMLFSCNMPLVKLCKTGSSF